MSPTPAQNQNALLSDGSSVVELAYQRLRRLPYTCIGDVVCLHHRGALVLSGRLPTYYMRQIALNAVSGLAGVERVVVEIRVAPLQ
jgi:hypothetical protein